MTSDAANNDGGSGRAIDTPLVIESVVIMVFAAVLYGVTFTFEEVPPILSQGVQPTVFPRGICIVMMLLAAAQIVKAMRLTPERIAELKPYKRVPRIVYVTALVLIAFSIVMPIIGTFPTLIVFCPGLALLWGERRWGLMGASFAAFIAAVYGLFVLGLGVPLP